MHGRDQGGAWALQSLSPLDRLPESVQDTDHSWSGAPVEPDGISRSSIGLPGTALRRQRTRWRLAVGTRAGCQSSMPG